MKLTRILDSHLYLEKGTVARKGNNAVYYLEDNSALEVSVAQPLEWLKQVRLHLLFIYSVDGLINPEDYRLPDSDFGTIGWYTKDQSNTHNLIPVTAEGTTRGSDLSVYESFRIVFSFNPLTWNDTQLNIQSKPNSYLYLNLTEFPFEGLAINLSGEQAGSFSFQLRGVQQTRLGLGIPVYQEGVDGDGLPELTKRSFQVLEDSQPLDFHFSVHGFQNSVELIRNNQVKPMPFSGKTIQGNFKTTKGKRPTFNVSSFSFVLDRYPISRNYNNGIYRPVLIPKGSIQVGRPLGHKGPIQLVLGASGSEFVTLEESDIIEFVTEGPDQALASILDKKDRKQPLKTLAHLLNDPDAPYVPTCWIKVRKKNGGAKTVAYTNQPERSAYYANKRVGLGGASSLNQAPLTMAELSDSQLLPCIPINGQEDTNDLSDIHEAITHTRFQLVANLQNKQLAVASRQPAGTDVSLITSQAYRIVVDEIKGKAAEYDFIKTLDGASRFLVVPNPNNLDFQHSIQRDEAFFVLSTGLLQQAQHAFNSFQPTIVIEGFRFEFYQKLNEPKPAEQQCITVFKFSKGSVHSYLEEEGKTEEYLLRKWSNSAAFGADAVLNELKHARKLLLEKYQKAKDKVDKGDEQYSYLLNIFENPYWQGVFTINIPLLDPNNLPQVISGLMSSQNLAAVEKPDYSDSNQKRAFTTGLTAEFLAFPMNQTEFKNGLLEIKQTAFFGLVDYDLERSKASDDFQKGVLSYLKTNGADSGCKFLMTKLLIRLASSKIATFASRALIRIPEVLGESISIKHDLYGENVFAVNGHYQRSGTNEGNYTFEALFDKADYQNPSNQAFIQTVWLRKLSFSVHDNVKNQYRFDLDGGITFNKLPAIRELFDFEDGGLDFKNIGFRFGLENPLPKIHFDFSRILCLPRFKLTGKGLMNSFPLKFNRFEWLEHKISLPKLGFMKIAKSKLELPKFALVFDFELGSLGDLSFLKKFSGELLLGWNPGTFDINNIWKQISLGLKINIPDPEGKININLAGVIKLQIREVDLCQLTYNSNQKLFFLRLIDVKMNLLGLKIPQKVEQELGGLIFTNPLEPSIRTAWFAVFNDKTGDALVKYLALGQRFGPPLSTMASLTDVDNAIEKTKEYLLYDYLPPYEGNQCKDSSFEVLKKSYQPDRNWIIAAQLNIEDLLNLGILFNDPVLYGLSLEFKMQGGLADFKLQILYKRLSDVLGVWGTDIRLPAYIRNQEFGAVSVTFPDFGGAIYSNGDWYVDIGYPRDLDFSRSCLIQIRPFVGWGGFYLAKYTSAEMFRNLFPKEVASYWKPGASYVTVQAGFSFRVGLGAYIDKGIFYAGASLSVFGILEGAFVFEKNQQGLKLFAPDAFALKGRIGIIAEVVGYVDFKIIKASVHIRLSVEYGLALAVVHGKWSPLILHVEGRVSVSIRVTIACFRIFRKKICIIIHLSFRATIRMEFTIGGSRAKRLASSAKERILALQNTPITIPFALVPEVSKGRVKRTLDATETLLHTQFYIALHYKEGGENNFRTLIEILDKYDNLFSQLGLTDYKEDKPLITGFIKKNLDVNLNAFHFQWHEEGEEPVNAGDHQRLLIMPAPAGWSVDYSAFLQFKDAICSFSTIPVTEIYLTMIENHFDDYRTEYFNRRNSRKIHDINTVDARPVIWKEYIKMLLLSFTELMSTRNVSWTNLKNDSVQRDALLQDLVGMVNLFYRGGLLLPKDGSPEVIPFVAFSGQTLVVQQPANPKGPIVLKRGEEEITRFTDKDDLGEDRKIDSLTEIASEINRFRTLNVDSELDALPVYIKKITVSSGEQPTREARTLPGLRSFEEISHNPYALVPLKVTLSRSQLEISQETGARVVHLLDVPEKVQIGRELQFSLSLYKIGEASKGTPVGDFNMLTQLEVTLVDKTVVEDKATGEQRVYLVLSNARAADLQLLNAVQERADEFSIEVFLRVEQERFLYPVKGRCIIYKTNSSPKTHPPIILKDRKMQDVKESSVPEVFQADTTNHAEFLRLLHEAQLTNSGGFYLEFILKDPILADKKLSGAAFHFIYQQRVITPVVNKISFAGAVDSEKEYLALESLYFQEGKQKTYIQEYMPIIPAHCFAFHLERDPEEPKDNHNTKDATSRYLLLEFSQKGPQILTADQVLPIIPHEKEGRWTYTHVSPVSKPTEPKYQGVGKNLSLQLGWRDVYGYRAGSLSPDLNYTHHFFDKLINMDQWPYIHCNYKLEQVSGSQIKWRVVFSVDVEGEDGKGGLKKALKEILTQAEESIKMEQLGGLLNKYQLIEEQLTAPYTEMSVLGQPITEIKKTLAILFDFFKTLKKINVDTLADSIDAIVQPVPPIELSVSKDYASLFTTDKSFVKLDLQVEIRRSQWVHPQISELARQPSVLGAREVMSVSYAPILELGKAQSESEALHNMQQQLKAGGYFTLGAGWAGSSGLALFLINDHKLKTETALKTQFQSFGFTPLQTNLYSGAYKGTQFSGIDLDQAFRLVLDRLETLLSPVFLYNGHYHTKPQKEQFNILNRLKKRLAAHLASGKYTQSFVQPVVIPGESELTEFRHLLLQDLRAFYRYDVLLHYSLKTSQSPSHRYTLQVMPVAAEDQKLRVVASKIGKNTPSWTMLIDHPATVISGSRFGGSFRCKVTHLEHNIRQIQPKGTLDPYEMAEWIELLEPVEVASPTFSNVPLVQRIFPPLPRIISQEALQQYDQLDRWEQAKAGKWRYKLRLNLEEYNENDQVYIKLILPRPGRLTAEAKTLQEILDLDSVAYLGMLINQKDFKTEDLLSEAYFPVLQNLLVTKAVGERSLSADLAGETYLNFQIKKENQGWRARGINLPAGIRCTEKVLDYWEVEGLDIFQGHYSVLVQVHVTRNELESDTGSINPAFVYQTPIIQSINPFYPHIVYHQPVDFRGNTFDALVQQVTREGHKVRAEAFYQSSLTKSYFFRNYLKMLVASAVMEAPGLDALFDNSFESGDEGTQACLDLTVFSQKIISTADGQSVIEEIPIFKANHLQKPL